MYTIRDATEQDAAALVGFNWNLAKETEDKELDRDVLRAGIREILTQPARGFYVVAVREEEVVGATMVTKEWSDWRNGDFWWIQSVYVAAPHRRQGIFQRLFQRVQEKARQDRVCGFRLYVEQDNQIAQTTYLKLGMQETAYKMFEMVTPQ